MRIGCGGPLVPQTRCTIASPQPLYAAAPWFNGFRFATFRPARREKRGEAPEILLHFGMNGSPFEGAGQPNSSRRLTFAKVKMILGDGRQAYRRSALIVLSAGLLTAGLWVCDGFTRGRWPQASLRVRILYEFRLRPNFREVPRQAFPANAVGFDGKRLEQVPVDRLVSALSASAISDRASAITALGHTRSTKVVGFLGPILLDSARPAAAGCVFFPSLAETSSAALQEIMPFTGLWLRLRTGHRFLDERDWIPWWEKNRSQHTTPGWKYELAQTINENRKPQRR